MTARTPEPSGPTLTAITEAVSALPAQFMLDPKTYASQVDRGYQGMDFYFFGRAGVLGDVPGQVVAAAMVFFQPELVADCWDRARSVCRPTEAAAAFAGCLVRWAGEHLPEGPDYPRLADLLGRVAGQASPAGAPLFAGWRLVPEPQDPAALALHRLNVLRELQGALHGAAVLASGLTPYQAMSVRSPHMVQLFGWGEPLTDLDAVRPVWQRAQDATEAAMGRALTVLQPDERRELGDLLAAAAPR